MDSARVDQWLWSVRLYKTRTAAMDACRGGHVRVNGVPAKPSTHVRPGDRVAARAAGRDRALEVVHAIAKRVSAAEAAACLVDHTPRTEPKEELVFRRDRGSGRPTKRERRRLDRFRA